MTDYKKEAYWSKFANTFDDALLLIRNVRMTDREACTVYEVSSRLLNYRINVTGVQYQIEARR